MTKRGTAHERFLRKAERLRKHEARIEENRRVRHKARFNAKKRAVYASSDARLYNRETAIRRYREGRGRTLAGSLSPVDVDLTLRWYRQEMETSVLVRGYGTKAKGVLRCARALRDLVRDGYLELETVGVYHSREECAYRWFRGVNADSVLRAEFDVTSITKSILRASAILLELLNARRLKLRTTPELERKFFDTEWVELSKK